MSRDLARQDGRGHGGAKAGHGSAGGSAYPPGGGGTVILPARRRGRGDEARRSDG